MLMTVWVIENANGGGLQIRDLSDSRLLCQTKAGDWREASTAEPLTILMSLYDMFQTMEEFSSGDMFTLNGVEVLHCEGIHVVRSEPGWSYVFGANADKGGETLLPISMQRLTSNSLPS
jgi:predicted metal-binding protein